MHWSNLGTLRQAQQLRVKAAAKRLAEAEEEGDYIQTTHCDGLSQIPWSLHSQRLLLPPVHHHLPCE